MACDTADPAAAGAPRDVTIDSVGAERHPPGGSVANFANVSGYTGVALAKFALTGRRTARYPLRYEWKPAPECVATALGARD